MTSAENKTQNVFDCFIKDYTSTSLIAGLNKYTSKELQTGEFDPNLSTGLEMFDFGSRFYDPQLGRWSIHDPAEQFHNPYLGIGNNPVIYSDPNGQWAFLAPMIKSAAIGFGIGGGSYLAQVGFSDGGFENFDGRAFMKSAAFGALSGAASFGIGELNLGGLNSAAAHAASQGLITKWSGGDFQDGAASALFSSITSTSMLNSGSPFAQSKIGNLTVSGITGGLVAKANDGNFWQGAGTAVTVAGLNHLMHHPENDGDPVKKNNPSEPNPDDNGPWIKGPYEDGTSWDNIKAHAASLEQRWHGNDGLEKLGQDLWYTAGKSLTTGYQIVRMIGTSRTTIIPFFDFQKILIDDFIRPQYATQNR